MNNKTEPAADNSRKDVMQWACQSVAALGYTLSSHPPEEVLNTPWSYVARLQTSDGYIYLKHTPKLLALEANIIQVLREQFHISVAEVIAHNATLNCFLMKDAGSPLRQILKKKFDAPLYCQAIEQFTSMQLTVADHLNIFLIWVCPIGVCINYRIYTCNYCRKKRYC